ncbi:MAG: flavin reductase family protein [Roseibium sp.]|nr:flavin reductase family protein [Roseibium sp.]
MTTTTNPNALSLRRALGRFTTGICVAATRNISGAPVGLTINSFNSVSLNPPLVLWSIGRGTASHADFERSDRFAISVLASTQKTISDRFARPGDKFADVDWGEGRFGSPVIAGAIAVFECRTAFRYEGGDHLILVGAVEGHRTAPGKPLLYVDGQYGVALPHPEVA